MSSLAINMSNDCGMHARSNWRGTDAVIEPDPRTGPLQRPRAQGSRRDRAPHEALDEDRDEVTDAGRVELAIEPSTRRLAHRLFSNLHAVFAMLTGGRLFGRCYQRVGSPLAVYVERAL